jgi:hypothetical protein
MLNSILLKRTAITTRTVDPYTYFYRCLEQMHLTGGIYSLSVAEATKEPVAVLEKILHGNTLMMFSNL